MTWELINKEKEDGDRHTVRCLLCLPLIDDAQGERTRDLSPIHQFLFILHQFTSLLTSRYFFFTVHL